MPHHVRLTLLDLTGCTLKPELQREASVPTTVPRLPPDLGPAPLVLHFLACLDLPQFELRDELACLWKWLTA